MLVPSLNMNKKNQTASPTNFFKIEDPPIFQKYVTIGQLEKPRATTTLKFDIKDITFAENFVVMKKLTGPTVGLVFRRQNSVVIDTPHSLIHFSNLTMQINSANSEIKAKLQLVLTNDNLMIPLMTTKTMNASFNYLSECKTRCTVTSLKRFTETTNLLI